MMETRCVEVCVQPGVSRQVCECVCVCVRGKLLTRKVQSAD